MEATQTLLNTEISSSSALVVPLALLAFFLQASLQIFCQSFHYKGEFVWRVILLGPRQVSAIRSGVSAVEGAGTY